MAASEKQGGSEPEPSPHTDVAQRSVWRSIALVATCTMAMILNTAGSSATSIALPTIGQKLNIVEYKLQWILSAYSLSSGCLLLLLGRLADLYGRKLVFQLGLLWMSVFHLGCGFSQNQITIDVLRGLQGIGGAAVVPASLGILAHAFPPSRARAIAFSTFAAGAPMGGAVGTLIGGVLTQLTAATWRSVFFLMAGLGVACFAGGFFAIDKDLPSTEKDRRVDWLGAFLVTAGLVLIVFVLSDGTIAPEGWGTSYIIAFIVIGVFLLALFVAWQYYLEKIHSDPDRAARAATKWYQAPPLMKLSIWTRMNGRMAAMLCISFLEWCSFFSWMLWVQLYYQNFLLLTPVLTMVRLIPMFITGCICNFTVAVVVGRIDVVFLIVAGTALTAVANLLFAVINVHSSYWAFGFPAAILSVFGADFVFASGSLFVAKISLPHEQSLAGALFQTMSQLGNSFGLAITTIIFNSVLAKDSKKAGVAVNKSGTNAPYFAQEDAYKAAMWGGFAFGVLGALLAAVFLRQVGIVGHRQDAVNATDEEATTHADGEFKASEMEKDPEAFRQFAENKQ
ncbi:uncharacterized protein PHACADRAFT_251711 [Phanerochaete carnosa HHB-10118-sp]|uniref:Major facilitator superfamily (MFS) profile domain-containing protein n=1 Tax=Phanerochaete carnosa (strain HHB-10118-sp) TaxID=650164 RepID=K5W1Y1_PHACS|nr:uncharacterized protein PHACADRAFT_251711 [Phanerochaete carnosa HHB-10118-sp]EKM57838.1 hypothetical protein PHACADRAFT_251711 [Phanerochaete carnosa HHB-10118-sp]